jgi:hypothetical protein
MLYETSKNTVRETAIFQDRRSVVCRESFSESERPVEKLLFEAVLRKEGKSN